jgi:RNA polymerase-binding transcription factor DksA
MLREDHAVPAAAALAPPAEPGSPYWRALLEDRWLARLQEVTKLSLAYHQAAPPDGDAGSRQAERLLRRTVAARRKLADIEEALGRLASGDFGHCEQCRSPLARELLAVVPETRYCPACAESAWPTRCPDRC